jgi:hypothetical protein
MTQRISGGFTEFLEAYPDGTAPPDTLILCGGCRTRRPPSEFYVARALRVLASGERLTGSTSRCRICANMYQQRRKAPAYAIMDAAKASGCVDCGHVDTDHPEVFDFDHVIGEKVANIAALPVAADLGALRAELAKCEVVCANCHRIRTRQRGPVTRGRDRA